MACKFVFHLLTRRRDVTTNFGRDVFGVYGRGFSCGVSKKAMTSSPMYRIFPPAFLKRRAGYRPVALQTSNVSGLSRKKLATSGAVYATPGFITSGSAGVIGLLFFFVMSNPHLDQKKEGKSPVLRETCPHSEKGVIRFFDQLASRSYRAQYARR
jgi:hypothetical protein